jgi:cytochrome o ubiquinol oxidase subunit II
MNILDPQGPIGAAEKTILVDSLVPPRPLKLPSMLAQ